MYKATDLRKKYKFINLASHFSNIPLLLACAKDYDHNNFNNDISSMTQVQDNERRILGPTTNFRQ